MARVNLRRHEGGLAVLEAALIFPLLLLLTFALIEYSWVFLNSQQLGGAARHGVRVGVLETATSAQVQAAVDALLDQANLADSGYTLVVSPTDVSSLLPGETLTVTITVPYANIALTGFPLPLPANLVGQASMAKEGIP